MLGGGTRDLPERQQTLRSTIEWSERLLDEDERSTFRLFSVFATARIEAVEAVASRLNGDAGMDVLPRLVSLVDKSLVRSLDEGGHRRLAMLETIRDYAAERLDELPEERDAARLRARRALRRRRARDGGSASPAGSGRRSSPSWRPISATCAPRGATGSRPATWGGSTRCSTRCGRCTTTVAGTTGRSNSRTTCSRPSRRRRRRRSAPPRRSWCARASLEGSWRSAGTPRRSRTSTRMRSPSSRRRGSPRTRCRCCGASPASTCIAATSTRASRSDAGSWNSPSCSRTPRSRRRATCGSARTSYRSASVDEGLEHLDRAIGLVRSAAVASGRLRLGPSPGDRALHDVGVRAVVDRSSCACGRARCGCPARRGGTAPPVQRRVRAVPRGLPRRVAQGLGERARAGVAGARHRRGARLPGVEGARAHLPRRVGSGAGQSGRGHGAQRSGDRSLPGPHDAAGLLADAAVGARTGVRDRRPARGRPRTGRPGDRADARAATTSCSPSSR